MPVTQETHRIAITTPLGKDALLLRGFSGSEAISQLFHFDLDLLSENDSISFQDVVGKNVTLHINTAEGGRRHWNGFISRFSQGPQERRLTAYHAQMVPWLWFLTRTSDCRIFQNMKVPDIVTKIFTDLNFQDFELRLKGTYTPRDYCVQYRETDFNFVSRLMETEGISYFFDHQDSKHILVLADDPSANKPCPNQPEARYHFYGPGTTYEEDLITEWHYHEQFRTGAWSQTDYNFETPSTSLAVTVNGKNPYEIYEYPGEHSVRDHGDRLARIRLEEQTTPLAVSHGGSTCRNFRSGFQFTLQDHYRTDLNQRYLITSLRHTATANYEVGAGGGGGMSYRNSFECIPASTTFRPPRVTPEPYVQGCQTAVVVGPAGEEIYTDKYGRVKVQFHWDREGKKNENSSCWVRVSHPWAGQGWGAISIPRIGQEVVVDFLEGDPDRPIIIGRVYNAEQMPPFGMPGGAVVSGIKSNSTKGGGGYNEISLNDTKGTELINVHAQYDQQKKVEHDERVNIGNDRTEEVGRHEKITIGGNRTEHVVGIEDITIDHDRKEHVQQTETIHIDSDRTEVVGGEESITINKGRTETVKHGEKVTVYLTRTHNVGINDMLNVGGAQEVTVGGYQVVNVVGKQDVNVGMSRSVRVLRSQKMSIGKNLSEIVKVDHNLTVKGARKVSVGKTLDESVGEKYTLQVKQDRGVSIEGSDTLTVVKDLIVTAKQSLTLESGKAKIVLKSSGEIEISGSDITVTATGSLKESGVTIDSSASGVQTVTGNLVKINC